MALEQVYRVSNCRYYSWEDVDVRAVEAMTEAEEEMGRVNPYHGLLFIKANFYLIKRKQECMVHEIQAELPNPATIQHYTLRYGRRVAVSDELNDEKVMLTVLEETSTSNYLLDGDVIVRSRVDGKPVVLRDERWTVFRSNCISKRNRHLSLNIALSREPFILTSYGQRKWCHPSETQNPLPYRYTIGGRSGSDDTVAAAMMVVCLGLFDYETESPYRWMCELGKRFGGNGYGWMNPFTFIWGRPKNISGPISALNIVHYCLYVSCIMKTVGLYHPDTVTVHRSASAGDTYFFGSLPCDGLELLYEREFFMAQGGVILSPRRKELEKYMLGKINGYRIYGIVGVVPLSVVNGRLVGYMPNCPIRSQLMMAFYDGVWEMDDYRPAYGGFPTLKVLAAMACDRSMVTVRAGLTHNPMSNIDTARMCRTTWELVTGYTGLKTGIEIHMGYTFKNVRCHVEFTAFGGGYSGGIITNKRDNISGGSMSGEPALGSSYNLPVPSGGDSAWDAFAYRVEREFHRNRDVNVGEFWLFQAMHAIAPKYYEYLGGRVCWEYANDLSLMPDRLLDWRSDTDPVLCNIMLLGGETPQTIAQIEEFLTSGLEQKPVFLMTPGYNHPYTCAPLSMGKPWAKSFLREVIREVKARSLVELGETGNGGSSSASSST
jgi:hypothetical protein